MGLKNNKVVGEEDKISKLPDEIIHHILSFLPIKCGMSTCVLSKRWKYLSHSTRTLDFRHWRSLSLRTDTRKELKLETKQFMNFLDTVLFRYKKPNIQKFYIDLDKFFDESRVHGWIGTIADRKVEELGVYDIRASSIFPLSFFTCDSLVLLELEFDRTTGGEFNIPNTVSFPKLKILRLRGASFVKASSSSKLFSNCPLLEKLRLCHCLMPDGLWLASYALTDLCIINCNILVSAVKISAPNLQIFSYRGLDPPVDFVQSSFPSLVVADVDFQIDEQSEYPNGEFVKLLEKLSSVKFLYICVGLFLVLTGEDILSTGSLQFNSLTHLDIVSQFGYPILGLDSFPIVRTFFRFLQLSPNLESIVFSQSIHNPNYKKDDGCWSVNPKCSFPHLKSITFKDFCGEPMELNAIKLFLKYAGILETVTIVASPDLSDDHEKQLHVMKLLLKFPKPANCEVKYLTNDDL